MKGPLSLLLFFFFLLCHPRSDHIWRSFFQEETELKEKGRMAVKSEIYPMAGRVHRINIRKYIREIAEEGSRLLGHTGRNPT